MASFPFPREINPSISTLVENAQRANPALAKKTKDHVKAEKMKTHHARQVSGDSAELSEDMLGDMDPDEYRQRDSSSEFKQLMKEWQEESRKKEAKKEEEEDREQEQKEPGDQRERQEKEDDQSRKQDEKAGFVPEKEVDTGPRSEDFPGREPEITGDIAPEDTSRAETLEQVEEETSPPVCLDEDREIEQKWEGVLPEKSTDVAESEIEVELSKPPEEPSKEQKTAQASEFVSLLTYDDGFIIADPKKKAVPSGDSDKVLSKSKEKAEKAKVKPVPSPLEEKFKKVFSELIISESKGLTYEKLCQQLRCFGVKVLELCRENSERVLLVPRGKTLKDYANLLKNSYEEWITGIRWGYFPNEKLVVLGEEVINNGDPGIRIPILYFAFAFDHALGGEAFASERSPAVLSNFRSCKNRESGRQFIDSFSSISPAHYFALAVEAFLTAPHGQLTPVDPEAENALCTKEELYDIDRPLFSYIEYLFHQINKGTEVESTGDSKRITGVV